MRATFHAAWVQQQVGALDQAACGFAGLRTDPPVGRTLARGRAGLRAQRAVKWRADMVDADIGPRAQQAGQREYGLWRLFVAQVAGHGDAQMACCLGQCAPR